MSAVAIDTAQILKEFGNTLRTERVAAGHNVHNFAKHTGGISKDDLRDFEAGKRVPDKVTLKKLFHWSPILMKFEPALRHLIPQSGVHHKKPKARAKPVHAPTRMQRPPKLVVVGGAQPAIRHEPKPRVEVITQNPLPPAPLSYQPFTQVTLKKKTRAEMLSELGKQVTKRLGHHTAEDYDFTIKNDGKILTVKLQVAESKEDPDALMDSGCYVNVVPAGSDGLKIFCKGMTGGNLCDTLPRVHGVRELLGIAVMLNEAVEGVRVDG